MTEDMNVSEVLRNKKMECRQKLLTLYAAFNKTELSLECRREKELREELEEAETHLQVLKDRQDVIGGAGHNRFCPCCGLKLPRGYFKKLLVEVKEQEQKVEDLRKEYNELATTREQDPKNALTLEIGRMEKELAEIEQIEREAKDVGII